MYAQVLRLEGRDRPLDPTVGNVLISTFCVSHDVIAVGGFFGKLSSIPVQAIVDPF